MDVNGDGHRGKHGGKFMNLLDTYVPVRNLIVIAAMGASLVIGGLKLEAFIFEQFSGVIHLQDTQTGKLDAQATQLEQIRTAMAAGNAARDLQMAELRETIGKLAGQMNGNQDLTAGQIAEINLRISNIVKDIAVMKCRIGKC